MHVQFIRFDTKDMQLKKIRTKLESIPVNNIDFCVVDNFYPFTSSYIFVLMR